MEMVLALVKLLAYNVYVILPYFFSYLIFLSLLPRFLEHLPFSLDTKGLF